MQEGGRVARENRNRQPPRHTRFFPATLRFFDPGLAIEGLFRLPEMGKVAAVRSLFLVSYMRPSDRHPAF